MSDIVKRLRYIARDDQDMPSVYCGKAADEIERLRAALERQTEAEIHEKRERPPTFFDIYAEQSARIERLRADMQTANDARDELAIKNSKLQAALESIANSTCCEGCQEAKRVARASIGGKNKCL